MAGVVDSFKAMIRELIGLPTDAGAPPDIMRLGLYPARVDVCQSDGKHCDVTPADTRISKGEKNVEILTGIPGAVATVEPGSIVLLGWRRGDPGSPYCMPAWAMDVTVDKLIFNATMVILGAESGSDFIALAAKVKAWFDAFNAAVTGWVVVPQDGGAALKAALATLIAGSPSTNVAASQAKAK